MRSYQYFVRSSDPEARDPAGPVVPKFYSDGDTGSVLTEIRVPFNVRTVYSIHGLLYSVEGAKPM